MNRPTATADRWVVRARPNPDAAFRLFCIPHAGGGASTFRGWADSLPADVEVCAVQLPGRENRMAETPFTHVAPLVEAWAEAAAPWLDRPFAVFGHSNGALVAFEWARWLRRTGGPQMAHLFASGRRAPDLPPRQRDTHDLPDHEFLADLRSLGGMPEEVLAHPELLQLLLPVLRADLTVHETYRWYPEPPLELPVTAYVGNADHKVCRDEAEGWERHTTKAFTLRVFPGDHFYLASQRDLLLKTLAKDLAPTLRATKA